ncbi:MAG: hypothetical protein HYY04_08355 [Chloroflexi bacterium]|nr:hypothetical protein [Chloroflexota bacterium]
MSAVFRRVSFLLLLAALIAVGTGLRLSALASAGGKPGLVGDTPSSVGTTTAEGDGAPAQTVLDFYQLMDEGSFDQAAELAVEIQWQWTEDGERDPVGLKARERFVADSEQELGIRGSLMSIFEAFAEPDGSAPPDLASPELLALRGVAGAAGVSQVAWVNTWGTVKLTCGIRGWGRRMAVVKLDGVWKVLLPPPDQTRRSRVQAWFPATGPIILRP